MAAVLPQTSALHHHPHHHLVRYSDERDTNENSDSESESTDTVAQSLLALSTAAVTTNMPSQSDEVITESEEPSQQAALAESHVSVPSSPEQETMERTTTTITPMDDNDEHANESSFPPLEEEDVESEPMDATTTTAISTLRQSYGGLSNLGNTCYMASSLQMLASLDHFVEALRAQEPAGEEDDSELGSESNDERLQLRRAFLQLMQRLANGETDAPYDFKAAMDRRSSLFQGYRQQDSHEFLTALLDLLDEDYKPPPAEKEEEKENDSNDKAVAQAKDNNTPDEEDEPMLEEQPQKEEQEMEESESCCEAGSVAKKPRTDELPGLQETENDAVPMEEEEASAEEAATTPVEPSTETASLPRRKSFAELGVAEIGELLHGTHTSRETMVLPYNSTSSSSPSEPRCKLVGGRMNTADVMLTPYSGERPSLNHSHHSHSGSNHAAIRSAAIMEEDDENDHDDASTSTMANDTNTEDDETATTTTPSPVSSYFTTDVRVRLTCDSCKYSRTRQETYWHLSLEIDGSSSDTNKSVEDGLRRFFAPERREIKCEKCFCATATQTSEIVKLPTALLLHLKRFIVDVSPDYSSVTYRKNQSAVQFDPVLALEDDEQHYASILSDYLATDCSLPTAASSTAKRPACGDDSSRSMQQQQQQLPKYELRSVVNHIGSTASCGHYTADAHRRYPTNADDCCSDSPPLQREWTRFNDSYVTRITPQQAIQDSQQTAYLVLYELDQSS